MAVKGRSVIGIGLFVMLCGLVAIAHWYGTQRAPAAGAAQKIAVVHVTNPGDRGPGTLREAMFIVAGATGPSSISIEVPKITLETALPPLVNGHGVSLVGQASGAEIDAQSLAGGPVLDISGSNTSVEGVTIKNCPATAVLVRAVRFRLSASSIESCDVAVEVAENTSDTLLERNRFLKDRIGVRFGASGHNSAVADNEFSDNKDAGLWAVRRAPDASDDVIGIHENKWTEEGIAIVAGNIPVLIEHNDFINAHEADVQVVGAGTVIRRNHLNGGASMGIVAENARGAIIEDNEIEGLTAYGVMVRGSANTLVRANRIHNCGYGMAFVLGDPHSVSTAVDNTIIEPKYNGIDVIGDSPNLRRNQVLRAHAFAFHVENFQRPDGTRVISHPFMDKNNFGDGQTADTNAVAAVQPDVR